MTGESMADMLAAAARLYPGSAIGDRLQRLRPRICPFESLLQFVKPGSRVLDVGCGSGLFLGLLAMTGRLRSGVGVDPSGAALARATAMRDRLPLSQRDALSFVRGGVENLDAEQFGVVAMVDVMHHIPPAEQLQAFVGAAANVEPGGIFLFKDLAPRPRWRALANRAHDILLSHQWVHYVAPVVVDDWIELSGLEKEESLDLPRLWYAHHALVLRRAA